MNPKLKQDALNALKVLTKADQNEMDFGNTHYLWDAITFIRGCDSEVGYELKKYTTIRVRNLLGFCCSDAPALDSKERLAERDNLIAKQPGHWRSHWAVAVQAIRELKGWDLQTEQPWPIIEAPPAQVPEIQVYLQQQKKIKNFCKCATEDSTNRRQTLPKIFGNNF